jgi:hypothetical protein
LGEERHSSTKHACLFTYLLLVVALSLQINCFHLLREGAEFQGERKCLVESSLAQHRPQPEETIEFSVDLLEVVCHMLVTLERRRSLISELGALNNFP